MMVAEMVDAVVVQTDRVEQARRRLDGARVGLPALGWNVTVLGTTPPSRSSRMNPAISRT